jgi:hypothetical protein
MLKVLGTNQVVKAKAPVVKAEPISACAKQIAALRREHDETATVQRL